MNTNNLMLFPCEDLPEFNWDSMLTSKSYHTICGFPVKIDRIIRDLTGTTVLGVSGTMVVRGVKLRGVWDSLGNIMEFKKTLQLSTPRKMFANIENMLSGTQESMFRLVNIRQLSE